MLVQSRAAIGAWLRESPAIRAWKYRGRFPGLSVSARAKLDVLGDFRYGVGCGINEYAVMQVPADSTLSLGDNVYIGRSVELGPTALIQIGDHTTLQDRTLLVGNVRVGRYCLFSLNVLVTSGRHHFEFDPPLYIHDQDAAVLGDAARVAGHDQPVTIDDDCWLGVNTVVMAGVHIGKGCVIGAGSVVTAHLPPYSVAVGAPARVIRHRLDFRPPSGIRFDHPAHWPYFYSGVGLADNERRRGAAEGGLLVADRFSLALSIQAGDGIVLEACSPQGPLTLRHGDQVASLGLSYSPVRFAAEPDKFGHLRFDVEPAGGRWPVRLRFAGSE